MDTKLSLQNNHPATGLEAPWVFPDFPHHVRKLQVNPLLFVDMESPLDHSINIVLKRLCDIVISCFLVVVLLSWMIPLMALILLIDSRGPVFFVQKRLKKGGRHFNCIKFRTMVPNPEADFLAAYEHDHRITRAGRFLRKHHLDELPQLLNVLMGDMSLIGPRPYMISDCLKYESAVDHYKMRYKVRPGITGLAQSLGHFGSVSGIYNMHERVSFDLMYITKWSVKMDFQIICRTIWMIIKRRN
jgi:putative colanic acid biosysnthesis UDP-glucose lipid carrier transferase